MKLFDLTAKRIWVTGHQGMLGSALLRQLKTIANAELLTTSRQELDLMDSNATDNFFKEYQPDVVIHCAALVGGIEANKSQPVEFFNENLIVGLNVINGAAKYGVKKLVNFGSSCFYPRMSPQPITEQSLLTGELEPTNEGYALAKLSLAKLCQFYFQQYKKDFITIVPTNLYGQGDNFDPQSGHVIASLIYKFFEAKQQDKKQVLLWGTGRPLREFIHVEDAASGVIFLSEHYSSEQLINLSGGETVSIKALAEQIAQLSHYRGEILFDESKPDGMMKKSLDNTQIRQLGWQPKLSLNEGLKATIQFYLVQYSHAK